MQSKKRKLEDAIVVFTDGSCLGNGRAINHGGYACVFPHLPHLDASEYLANSTNNRAEYSAVIRAMNIANVHDPSKDLPLHVYSDSQLLIDSLTKWLPGWIRRGWKKSDGKPVKNIDLLQILDAHMKAREVVFRHVKAHTGGTDFESRYNAIADKAAKEASKYKIGNK